MGEPKARFDESDYRHRVSDLVAEHADASLDSIDAGQVVLRIERIAADTWFRLPPEFTMIAKTLMNLDRVVHILAPTFNPNAIIREEASGLLLRNLVKSVEPARIMSGVLEVKEFVERFPGRVNNILDKIGNNQLKIGVDAIDERIVLDGLQKIANRIPLGLVKSVEPARIMSGVLEVKEFVERFPGRVNNILDKIGNNQLKIGVDAIDERIVLDGLQKIANRITL